MIGSLWICFSFYVSQDQEKIFPPPEISCTKKKVQRSEI